MVPVARWVKRAERSPIEPKMAEGSKKLIVPKKV